MAQLSRPLIALLIATVVFFALWLVALKPSGSGTKAGGSGQGLGQFQADINAAHHAVHTANAASGKAGADPAAAATTASASSAQAHPGKASTQAHPGKTGAAGTTTATASASARAAHSAVHTKAAVSRFATVEHALRARKVLALLFYNPAAPDDRAVRAELRNVPTHRGRVFKLAIPLNEIENYTAVTEQVPVNVSPTLVLVASNGQTGEIVGYTDPFEVSQRVDDAVAAAR